MCLTVNLSFVLFTTAINTAHFVSETHCTQRKEDDHIFKIRHSILVFFARFLFFILFIKFSNWCKISKFFEKMKTTCSYR